MPFPSSLLPTLTFLLALLGIVHASPHKYFLDLKTQIAYSACCSTLCFFTYTYLHLRAVLFYFTNAYYSIEWINHNLFSQSPSDGHFHCFLSFAIKNNAVMSILVHMLFHILSVGLYLWVKFLETRVVCGEGDRVDGYRTGRLFIVSPCVSLNFVPYVLPIQKKIKYF